MSNPWDRYAVTGGWQPSGGFSLVIPDGAIPASVDAQVDEFRAAMIARAEFHMAKHAGVPPDESFEIAVWKRVQGWSVLRTWCWLLVKRRARDRYHERLWPWHLARALCGGMPVGKYGGPPVRGCWSSGAAGGGSPWRSTLEAEQKLAAEGRRGTP